ncbi:receptor-type tyrosine-protein phosphatase eta-like [Epinephelus moara]|uniref:receptor-type tyrosine-protein phosphatase eta-like n=1 Tax=Epinephelus moara TaxID=300413 RepID=UPI00214E988D|nr:receptor-type tyrosine-protein phosphatase eta-like [Epinephelus moara]
MGELSLKCKVSILISWALVLTCSAAKQDYFFHSGNLTWEQARNHCQVCYQDLATLTPENIQTIAKEQNITSDCWIGLRKNFDYNSTSNSSMPWSRWANGDPLLFQNWYPGWPVFRSSLPKRYCCTCQGTSQDATSLTGLAEETTENTTNMSNFTDQTVTDSTGLGESIQTVTDSTGFGESIQTVTDSTGFGESTSQNITPITAAPTMTTQPPAEAGCVPILDLSESDTNFIEDSCVAMLSFGAWVEKNCWELLSYICYEDRFCGEVTMTDRTSDSAVLTWEPGPGDISHYRVEVRVNKTLKTEIQTKNLTYKPVNLTGGTGYSVQVFPVKCGRDLNPQELLFYTTPDKVSNLTATIVTETSVHLSWNRPAGNVDFYLIKVQDTDWNKSKTESQGVDKLTPGTCYTFTVISGVLDGSTWSEETSIELYTKPGKVSNLTVSNNTMNSLQLKWVPPEGRVTGYRVVALNDRNHILYSETEETPEKKVTGLPMGTKITLRVSALTNGTSREGDTTTVVNYTAPGPISNLVLNSTYNSLTAKWSPSEGNLSSYTVKLQLDGTLVTTANNVTKLMKHFDGLMNAANYTVIVYAISGHIKSSPVADSTFTKPSPPTDLIVINTSKNQITFQWKAPVNISKATYSVKINSSFWKYSKVETLYNKTSYTSEGLISGTKYDFEVRTITTPEESSDPVTVSNCTEPDKREIGLSMLCSSAEILLCDTTTTRKSVFEQLKAHFNNQLGDNIFWELEEN